MNTYLISFLTLLFVCTSIYAQKNKLDSDIQKQLIQIAEKEHIPTLLVRIKSPKLNIELDYKNKSKGIKPIQNYGLASTSKLLTSVFILKLAEEGKLSLDDPIKNYIDSSDLKNIVSYDSITIRNLLNHTSGISDYTKNPKFMDMIMKVKGPKTYSEKIELIDKKNISMSFGKHAYSNSNYIFLEKIIEVVEKKSAKLAFNEFYAIHNLPNIQFPDQDDNNQAFFAMNANQVGDVSKWQEYYGFDGGVFANAIDLEFFLQKLFIEKSILSQKSLEEMMQWVDVGRYSIDYGFAKMNAYGLGLMRYEFGTHTWVGHAGSSLKYQCFAFFEPVSNTTIILQTNASGKHYNNAFFISLLKKITENM